MSKIEIIVGLFTIVYGIMLTELFASLHKLIRVKEKIKWHWLPLVSSWFLFMLIIKNWWGLAFSETNLNVGIFFFVVYGHLLILLYLAVATSLPDDVPEEGLCLKEYYLRNHRYFWLLMTGIILLAFLNSRLPKFIETGEVNLSSLIGNIVFVTFTIALAISKKIWLHAIILFLFIIQIILEIINKA